MKEKFLSEIDNENTIRAYQTIFNKLIPYEQKNNCKVDSFTYIMLVDFYVNEFRSISRNSISVKHSYLKKYLLYVGNKNILLIDNYLLDSLLNNKKIYLTLDDMKNLCEKHLINYSDKALMMLLYHTVKGKSHLEELRMLKVKDINLKLKTVTLPNRVITVNDDYTMEVLKGAIKEKYYHKYIDDDKIKAPSNYAYNMDCEYLFKSQPNKRNNNGLNPYSFSALTNKLFRFSNMFNTTVSFIFQSGVCNIINNYQESINKKLTILEIEFYLKNIFNLESVSSSEIYNMLKGQEKKEVGST